MRRKQDQLSASGAQDSNTTYTWQSLDSTKLQIGSTPGTYGAEVTTTGINSTLYTQAVQYGTVGLTLTITENINGKNVQVTYSKEGYPDFSPFSHPDYPDPVEINMTGNNYKDFKAANEKIGLSGANPPDGYTWHHLEDGKHMLLVDSSVHDATLGGFPHTGGASIVKNN